MTYIEYLNEFNKRLRSQHIPGNARLLYYSLLSVFNEAGWPASIQVDNYRLMSMVDTRTERVAISARDKLVDFGFIRYSRGKKGCPNSYFLTEYTQQKVSEFDSESVSVSDSETVSVSGSETVSHIKTKKKTKTKNITPLPPEPDFGPELQAAFADWQAYKREKRQGYKPTGLRSLTAQVKKHAEQYGEAAVAELIRECMASNWQGIIWDRLTGKQQKKPGGSLARSGREDPGTAQDDIARMERYREQLRKEAEHAGN